jgi:hypothetical protein
MTHDELIALARTHTKDMPELSGESWATLEMLPKARAVETVSVYFESDDCPGKMLVVLERETGKFVLSSLIFPRSKGK